MPTPDMGLPVFGDAGTPDARADAVSTDVLAGDGGIDAATPDAQAEVPGYIGGGGCSAGGIGHGGMWLLAVALGVRGLARRKRRVR
jgi:uncharacterized protein (TIGR03382 family)